MANRNIGVKKSKKTLAGDKAPVIKKLKPHFMRSPQPKQVCPGWFAPAIWILTVACPVRALEISMGKTNVPPGIVASVPVRFADAPVTPVSAFAFYVTNDTRLGVPSVAAGLEQTNLSCFVDDFGAGLSRVTGFVLSEPAISNGHVATLSFTLPSDLPAGQYPIAFSAVVPTNAPPAPNPEVRALVTGELLASSGSNGWVQIPSPPVVTDIVPQAGPAFLLSFAGSEGLSYTVQAATNLNAAPTPTYWLAVTNLTAGTGGLFEFLDLDATNHPQRFYRAVFP